MEIPNTRRSQFIGNTRSSIVFVYMMLSFSVLWSVAGMIVPIYYKKFFDVLAAGTPTSPETVFLLIRIMIILIVLALLFRFLLRRLRILPLLPFVPVSWKILRTVVSRIFTNILSRFSTTISLVLS